jgi:hypothetical protein
MAREDITMVDVLNLQSIKKKLKIGVKDINRANNVRQQEYATEEDWARALLRFPETMTLKEYLTKKLNEKEIVTFYKLLKEGVL